MTRLYQIPESIQEDTQWTSVLFCIPDTPAWRRLVIGAVENFGYGRAYDERTGSVIDAVSVGQEIFETMQICDIDTKLERIAVAIETIAEAHEPITLDDILTDMEAQSTFWSNLADLAEVLTFLRDSIPSFTISLPLGEWIKAFGTWRYRQSHINMLEDIAMSQRMQATAQMGTSGHSIYNLFDDAAEKLLLPAGFAGKAVWLWNRLKPEEIGAWASWVSDIAGFLLGNIRDGIYSVAASVDNIEASFSPKLVATCSGCGGVVCNCFQTQEPADVEGVEFGAPPRYYDAPDIPQGGTEYYERKCSIANSIYSNVLAYSNALNDNNIAVFIGQEAGEKGLLTMLGVILGELSTPVPILDAVAGGILGYLASIAAEVIFGSFDTQNIVDGLTAEQDALICNLYDATDTQQAYSSWDSTLTAWGLSAGEMALIRAIMTKDVLLYLFFSGSPVVEASYHMASQILDCNECQSSTYSWTFDVDTEGWVYDAGSTAPPSTSVGDWVDNELRSVIAEVGGAAQEGTWSIDMQSEGIVAAQGMQVRTEIKRVRACATGVRVGVSYTDGASENTLYDINYWTDYQLATHTVGAANAGKTVKSLDVYTTIGPACGSDGDQDIRINSVEFEV